MNKDGEFSRGCFSAPCRKPNATPITNPEEFREQGNLCQAKFAQTFQRLKYPTGVQHEMPTPNMDGENMQVDFSCLVK